jgi:hypothetical protein
MEARPGTMEAHPEPMVVYLGAVKPHPGPLEANPGAWRLILDPLLDAHPGAIESHPWAVEAHLGTLHGQIEP